MVKNIESKSEFEKIKNSKNFLVLDFWAQWCGPCKQFKPIFEEVSKDFEGKNVEFYKLDIDENSEVAEEYGIMSIPTIIVLKDKEKIKENVGALGKEDFKDFVESVLND